MNNREEFLYRCLTVDFETTGLDVDEGEIVEQGLSANVKGKGTVKDTWVNFHTTLHGCKNGIPPEASAVSNITDVTVWGKPFFTIESFGAGAVSSSHSILVSHNAAYDCGIFEKYVSSASEYEAYKSHWLCTLKMIRKLHANDPTFTQFNLAYLRYRLNLNVEILGDTHRAGFDSYLTGLLLDYILDELEERGTIDPEHPYFKQIKVWMEQPIMIELMPFGKYQGLPISSIPVSYLDWGMDNMDKLNPDLPDFDPDLAATFLAVLEDR